MKKAFIAILICGFAPAVHADLALSEGVFDGVFDPVRYYLVSDTDDSYACWIWIDDLGIADYAAEPTFTQRGNPNGDSRVTYYEDGWYEITVASFDPANPILSGDHVVIEVACLRMGESHLRLYAEDAMTELDREFLFCIPEPTTFVLLGLGTLALLRRRKPRGCLPLTRLSRKENSYEQDIDGHSGLRLRSSG
jgi:hypothetical protein